MVRAALVVWMFVTLSSSFQLVARGFTTRHYASSLVRSTTSSLTRRTMATTTATANPTTTSAIASHAEDNLKKKKKYPIEMTEDERYLFDLNGYLIVRNVLSQEEVDQANAAIDKHAHSMVERSSAPLRNAKRGTKLYGTGPGRKDLGQVLEWGREDSKVFKSILAHLRLVPLFHGLLDKGYRMDHLPFVIAQDQGAEGFHLHGGTVDCSTGEYNHHLAYSCHHGVIRSALLGCNVMLTDHNAGDGGFCIVPGSHKSNFKMPPGMVHGTKYSEFLIQPATQAGDVVLFSEGTVHGSMAWMPSDRQRRVCLYRFAPATHAYGRSYFGHNNNNNNNNNDGQGAAGGWPKAMYDDLTDAQRAVLEPPYANRLDRPNILEDDVSAVEITTRSEPKKQHDQNVFGTKYF